MEASLEGLSWAIWDWNYGFAESEKVSLVELMKDKGPVWEEIVREK